MQATVYHNSRQADCTIAENQSDLKPYEIRIDIGAKGAGILFIHQGTRELVVHKKNLHISTPNGELSTSD